MSNLEEQIVNEMAEQMSSAIDFEILSDVLVKSCGWHKVTLEVYTNNKDAVDIAGWAHDNCKFKHMKNGRTFVFEDQGDAINFTLKWS